MHPRDTFPVGSRSSGRLLRSSLALVLVSVLVLGALGCGGGGGPKESKDNISGKVTLNGQAVAGTITFSGGGKEANSALNPDGSYLVNDPPQGDVDVLIKGFGGAGGGGALVPPVKEGAKTTMPGAGGAGGGGVGVAPPAKYSVPGTLKHTIPAGKSKKDFELQP